MLRKAASICSIVIGLSGCAALQHQPGNYMTISREPVYADTTKSAMGGNLHVIFKEKDHVVASTVFSPGDRLSSYPMSKVLTARNMINKEIRDGDSEPILLYGRYFREEGQKKFMLYGINVEGRDLYFKKER